MPEFSVDLSKPTTGLPWEQMVPALSTAMAPEAWTSVKASMAWYQDAQGLMQRVFEGVGAVRRNAELSEVGKQGHVGALVQQLRGFLATSPLAKAKDRAEGYRLQCRNRTLSLPTEPGKLGDFNLRARAVWQAMAAWSEERRQTAVQQAIQAQDAEGLQLMRAAPRILGLLSENERQRVDDTLVELGMDQGTRLSLEVLDRAVEALTAMEDKLDTFPHIELGIKPEFRPTFSGNYSEADVEAVRALDPSHPRKAPAPPIEDPEETARKEEGSKRQDEAFVKTVERASAPGRLRTPAG